MRLTNDARFMHCLPVRRNMIVTDEVLDGPWSVVVEQAANRVVSAQTVLLHMLRELAR
jgi:N-succinyl-L-ornithine transcarbamylase